MVIPKAAREKLGIAEGTLLQVVVRAQGLYLYPVKTLAKTEDSHQAFIKLLKSTAGAWGPPTKEEIKKEKHRHKLEIEASKRRQKAW